MSDIRKTNIRQLNPTLEGGTQTVMGGAQKVASKDSLIGKNAVKEYTPGPMPKGGKMGGEACSC